MEHLERMVWEKICNERVKDLNQRAGQLVEIINSFLGGCSEELNALVAGSLTWDAQNVVWKGLPVARVVDREDLQTARKYQLMKQYVESDRNTSSILWVKGDTLVTDSTDESLPAFNAYLLHHLIRSGLHVVDLWSTAVIAVRHALTLKIVHKGRVLTLVATAYTGTPFNSLTFESLQGSVILTVRNIIHGRLNYELRAADGTQLSTGQSPD